MKNKVLKVSILFSFIFILLLSLNFVNAATVKCSSCPGGGSGRCDGALSSFPSGGETLTCGGVTYCATACHSYPSSCEVTVTAGSCGGSVQWYNYYFDLDSDGYGNESTKKSTTSSSPPNSSYITKRTDNVFDCNDANPALTTFCNSASLTLTPTFSIDSAIWTNLINLSTPIFNSGLGDTVFLKVAGTNLTNQTLNYSINAYRSGAWSVLPLYSLLANYTSSYTPFNAGIYFYLVSSSDFASLVFKNSNNLSVSSSVNNSLPVARIDYPQNNYTFFVNSDIWFNQSSYDEDDFLNITWDFDDGTSYNARDYSLILNNNSANVMHRYSSPGIYTVRLTAKEMNRTQLDVKEIKVFILNYGVNVFPVISSPLPLTNYPSGLIPFNGTQSYVLKCLNESMSDLVISTSEVNCSYIHSPGNLTLNGYNLTLNWSFSGINQSISGSIDNLSVINFSLPFRIPGSYVVTLNLTYSSGSTFISGVTNTSFYSVGGWNCERTSSTSFWVNSLNRINSSSNCSFYNSTFFSSCCPINTPVCMSDGRCGGGIVTSCSQYINQSWCDSAPSSIAESEMFDPEVCQDFGTTNGLKTCYTARSCGCFWGQLDGETTESCSAGYTLDEICNNILNPTHTPTYFSFGTCTFQTNVQNECDSSGMVTLTGKSYWNGTGVRDADCKDYTRTFPCTSESETKLPFFNGFGIVLGLFLISVIYLLKKGL